MNKKLIMKMLEHCVRLLERADIDEKLYGESFVEFSPRGIEVIHPKEIDLEHHKGKIMHYARMSK